QLTDGSRHTHDPTIERSADDGVTKVPLRKTNQRSCPFELCDQSVGISHRLPGLPSGRERGIQLALRGCLNRSSLIDLLRRDVSVGQQRLETIERVGRVLEPRAYGIPMR